MPRITAQEPSIDGWIARNPCPATGTGQKLVYKWMCSAASVLNIKQLDSDAFSLVRNGVLANPTNANRKGLDRDVRRAIEYVSGNPAGGSYGRDPARWPDPNIPMLRDLVASYPTFNANALLYHSSNESASYSSPYSILEKLFHPKALVCSGPERNDANTRSLESFSRLKDFQNCQFIVPSPMAKRSGKNQEGKDSVRCLDATGPRRWLVIECDFKKEDDSGNPTVWAPLIEEWQAQGLTVQDSSARVLRHLARNQFPFCMVVDSGNKSLHGWFWVKDQPETAGSPLQAFMSQAAELGADTQLYTKCQFVRFPNGYRSSKSKIQEVIYFRPGAIPVSTQEHYE